MEFKVMDARNLDYPDENFDIILDIGTMDSQICGAASFYSIALMLKECQRVLKTGGYYVCISYRAPIFRERHFISPHLNFELKIFKIEIPDEEISK